jgi:hypothetical protein
MQQCLPLSALFLMLILVVFTTFIVAIFYEITAITFLQFDVINFSAAPQFAQHTSASISAVLLIIFVAAE